MIVYFHRNPVTYQIFYVGIASEKGRAQRPWKKDNRNNYWLHYVKKHSGFLVQIIFTELSNNIAREWERFFIWLLGKKINGGQLVNLADGGESNAGYKQNAEQRKTSSDRAKRIGTAHMMTKEAREKANKNISKALIGKLVGIKNPNFGNKWTDEMKKSLSQKKIGLRFSEEIKRIKTFKQILSKRNFVYDPNINCTFLSIKFAANHYNRSPQYVGNMISGKRPNKYNLLLNSSSPVEPSDSFLG